MTFLAGQEQHTSLHGSMFAYGGFGCLLMGQSGMGKSRLVAEIMQLGGKLVADDQVIFSMKAGMLMGGAPPELSGILELRGMGLVRVHDIVPRHVLHLVVRLEVGAGEERLPALETYEILGQPLPMLRLRPAPDTQAASLLVFCKAMQEGRILPPDWRPGA